MPFISKDFLQNIVNINHSKICAKNISDCDVFIGWSGSSLEAIVAAKSLGKLSILERGSSHFTYQQKILGDESQLTKSIGHKTNYITWQRELLEYELADYISVPSHFVRDSFIKYGIPSNKLLVNPYGVNLDSFSPGIKDDNVFRIIFVGDACARKGFHYLLQAFNELDLPDSELVHLGNIEKAMIPYIEKYNNKRIKMMGHVPQSELNNFYSQASVFVLPSLEDGMAMVQFQAMACGIPIISTTNSGAEDHLVTQNGKEGFIIPIRSVEAIKENINYLYNNESVRSKMGNEAFKRVSGNFSWSDYAQRYSENIDRVLTNRKKIMAHKG